MNSSYNTTTTNKYQCYLQNLPLKITDFSVTVTDKLELNVCKI